MGEIGYESCILRPGPFVAVKEGRAEYTELSLYDANDGVPLRSIRCSNPLEVAVIGEEFEGFVSWAVGHPVCLISETNRYWSCDVGKFGIERPRRFVDPPAFLLLCAGCQSSWLGNSAVMSGSKWWFAEPP